MKSALSALGLLLLAACGDVQNPNGMPAQTAGPASPRVLPARPPKPDPAAATTENPVMPADTSLAGAWLIFDGSLRGHDAATLNQLVDPEYGLWVLEQAGGRSLVSRVADVRQFRDQHRQPLFALDRTLLRGAPPRAVAALPVPACPAGTFAQRGTWAAPATAFRALDFWQTAPLHGGTRNQAQAAQGRVVRSVLQTGTGYQFHFAKSAGAGGRWRLVFVDLRGPCPR